MLVRVALIFAAGAVGCAVRAVPLTAAVAGLVVVVAGVFLITGETPAAGKHCVHVGGRELGGGGTDGGTSDGVITGSAFLFSFSEIFQFPEKIFTSDDF